MHDETFLSFLKTKQFCVGESVAAPIKDIDLSNVLDVRKMLSQQIEENERDEQKEGETKKKSGKSSETNRGKDNFKIFIFKFFVRFNFVL